MGLISDTTGSQSRFYLWDALGNLRTLLSPTGTVQRQGDWSAYGSPVCPTAPSTPFAWKGRGGAYTDSESNFLRMGVRYYAPNLARFLTRDPSGYAAGPNLYAFCGCDPIDFFDPTVCGPEEGEGWFWHGMRVLGDGTDRFNSAQGPLPLLRLPALFPALRDAHDSMYDFGYAAGSSKASADEVWAKGLKAGYCFGMAALEIYGTGKMLCEGFALAKACRGGCFVAGTPVWVVAEQGNRVTTAKSQVKGNSHSHRVLRVKPVEKVYNFVVEDDHSYFVGLHNGGTWVHNPGRWCLQIGPLIGPNGEEVLVNKLPGPKNYQGQREADNLLQSGLLEYKNWEASRETEARAFAERNGLTENPGAMSRLGRLMFESKFPLPEQDIGRIQFVHADPLPVSGNRMLYVWRTKTGSDNVRSILSRQTMIICRQSNWHNKMAKIQM